MSQEEQEQQKFWTQNFFRLKFFFGPNFFLVPKFFLNQKFFQTPNFFYLNFFRIKNFFLPEIIFGPIFFRPNIFSDPKLTSVRTLFGGRKQSFRTLSFLNWQGQRFYLNWSLTLKTKSCCGLFHFCCWSTHIWKFSTFCDIFGLDGSPWILVESGVVEIYFNSKLCT